MHFHVRGPVHLSFFQAVSRPRRHAHYLAPRLAFVEIDRGAKLLGNPWKAVRTEVTFCCDGTKRKQSKDGYFPGAGGGQGEGGGQGGTRLPFPLTQSLRPYF